MIQDDLIAIPEDIDRNDLIETHMAIARMTADLFGQIGQEGHQATLRSYSGGKMTPALRAAIEDFRLIEKALGSQALKPIARLLQMHAAFTRSIPQGEPNWRNKIIDIGVELSIMGDIETQVPGFSRITCRRLADVFPHLWS